MRRGIGSQGDGRYFHILARKGWETHAARYTKFGQPGTAATNIHSFKFNPERSLFGVKNVGLFNKLKTTKYAKKNIVPLVRVT